jgi:hypothetical protein
MVITKPRAMMGMAKEAMLKLNPKKEISHAVAVVPMWAPIITPIALPKASRPAFTILTTMTVVPLEDWIKAVIMIPVRIPLKDVDVIDDKKERNESPAAFWRPSLMSVMP